MADSHLVNTIELLQRRAFQDKSNAIVGAVMSQSSKSEDMMEADIMSFASHIYFSMVREAKSRGLWFSNEPPTPVPPYEHIWDTEEE